MVQLEAKILPLRTHAVELEELVAELKGKMAKLESVRGPSGAD